MSFIKTYSKHYNKNTKEQGISDCSYKGYYLVKTSSGERFFISTKVDVEALEKVADKVLTDTDYDYWIDYSNGFDVQGKVAWSNFDMTDKFF
jgi:hypothetical protein